MWNLPRNPRKSKIQSKIQICTADRFISYPPFLPVITLNSVLLYGKAADVSFGCIFFLPISIIKYMAYIIL